MIKMSTKTTNRALTLVVEKGVDADIGARVETDDFLFTTEGQTEAEVEKNLRNQIADFIKNEGADNPAWKDVAADDIVFTIEYDLTAIFEVFNAIKINAIADLAGLNKGLLRQYASGVKTASAPQAKKVQNALRELGARLSNVVVT